MKLIIGIEDKISTTASPNQRHMNPTMCIIDSQVERKTLYQIGVFQCSGACCIERGQQIYKKEVKKINIIALILTSE